MSAGDGWPAVKLLKARLRAAAVGGASKFRGPGVPPSPVARSALCRRAIGEPRRPDGLALNQETPDTNATILDDQKGVNRDATLFALQSPLAANLGVPGLHAGHAKNETKRNNEGEEDPSLESAKKN